MSLYITPAEYRHAPTAQDLSNLVPWGQFADQDAELLEVCFRASGWIDNVCNQPLVAQAHAVAFERLNVDSSGMLVIHPAVNPIAKMSAVAVGTLPSNVVALDLTDAYIDGRGPAYLPVRTTGAGYGMSPPSGSRALVRYSYVSGWPNTTLTVAASAGATSITVADPAGFTTTTGSPVADEPLRILGLAGTTETITVTSVAGNVVNLGAALTKAHAAGDVVSGLPGEVKQAAILAVTGLLNSRSSMAAVLGNTMQQGANSADSGIRNADLALAVRILSSYGRVR